jgi:hypothetical protein
MEVLDSLEMRWFMPQANPATAALQRWFAAVHDEGERTDDYLITGRDDLSFKARLAAANPAKTETKYLVGSLGIVDLALSMTGHLQRWTKLSLPVSDWEIQQHGSWLRVRKTRQVRKFEVDLSKLGAAEVAADETVPAGCGVELTTIGYDAAGACRIESTFALEAFGPAPRLLDILRMTVDVIVRSGGLPPLRSDASMSYATWLIARGM